MAKIRRLPEVLHRNAGAPQKREALRGDAGGGKRDEADSKSPSASLWVPDGGFSHRPRSVRGHDQVRLLRNLLKTRRRRCSKRPSIR